jgi:hypothetical protein
LQMTNQGQVGMSVRVALGIVTGYLLSKVPAPLLDGLWSGPAHAGQEQR